MTAAEQVPKSVSIAIATDTWLEPTTGIATSNIIGRLLRPSLVSVPTLVEDPTTTVSCP